MSVLFEYPITTPTSTVTLKSPQLGDTEQYNIKAQFEMSMDGSFYSTIDTEPSQTLLLTFKSLNKTDVENVIAFIKASAGSVVQYTDHLANIWQGVILTEPFEATTDGRKGGTCIEVSTISLQFRGSIIALSENRLLEDGFDRILETGDARLLESA